MRRVKPRKLRTGTEAERSAAGVVDRFYFETDTRTIHRDNGTSWEVFVPDITITDTSVVDSQAEMLALTAQKGDVAIRTDVSRCFVLAAAPASELGNWKELLTPPDAVLSVNGEVGAVDLDAADVGALATGDFKLSGLTIDSDLNLAGYKLKFADVRMKQWDATTVALMNHAETLYQKLILDILFPYTISYQQTETGVFKTHTTATASVDFQAHNGAVFQSAAKLRGGYLELARGRLTGPLLGTDGNPIYFDTAGTKGLKWNSEEDRFEMADRLVVSRIGDLAPGGGDFLFAAHGESDGMPEDGNVAGFIATFKGSASDDATSVFIGHGGDFDRNGSTAKAVMFACPDDGGWDWGAILGKQSGLKSGVPLYFDVDMDNITASKYLKWDSGAFQFGDGTAYAQLIMNTVQGTCQLVGPEGYNFFIGPFVDSEMIILSAGEMSLFAKLSLYGGGIGMGSNPIEDCGDIAMVEDKTVDGVDVSEIPSTYLALAGGTVSGDVSFSNSAKGTVFADRTDGHTYRIYFNNGSLLSEQVT